LEHTYEKESCDRPGLDRPATVSWPAKSGMPVAGEGAAWVQTDELAVHALQQTAGAGRFASG
jgi:hypothetical protein